MEEWLDNLEKLFRKGVIAQKIFMREREREQTERFICVGSLELEVSKELREMKEFDNFPSPVRTLEREVSEIRTEMEEADNYFGLEVALENQILFIMSEMKGVFGAQACLPLFDVLKCYQEGYEMHQLLAKMRINFLLERDFGYKDVGLHAQEILTNFRKLPDYFVGMDAHLAGLEILLHGERGGTWLRVCGMRGIRKPLLADKEFIRIMDPAEVFGLDFKALVKQGIKMSKAVYANRDDVKAFDDFLKNVPPLIPDVTGTALAGILR